MSHEYTARKQLQCFNSTFQRETEEDVHQRNGRKGNRLSFLFNGYLLTWLFLVHPYLGLEVLGMSCDCRISFFPSLFSSFLLPIESKSSWMTDEMNFHKPALISIPWFLGGSGKMTQKNSNAHLHKHMLAPIVNKWTNPLIIIIIPYMWIQILNMEFPNHFSVLWLPKLNLTLRESQIKTTDYFTLVIQL